MVIVKRIKATAVVQPPDDIHIRMDEYTARVLLTVLNNIGGPPHPHGPRGRMDEIRRTLIATGVTPLGGNEVDKIGSVNLFTVT